MIPLRLYIYAAIAAALTLLLWHDHHQTRRANEATKRANLAEATITAERLNTEKANAAAERYAITLENLKAASADTPVRAVRLCNAPVSVPAGRPPARTDASASDSLPPAPRLDPRDRWNDDGPDLGPQLYALADEADQCAAQLSALQGWISNR